MKAFGPFRTWVLPIVSCWVVASSVGCGEHARDTGGVVVIDAGSDPTNASFYRTPPTDSDRASTLRGTFDADTRAVRTPAPASEANQVGGLGSDGPAREANRAVGVAAGTAATAESSSEAGPRGMNIVRNNAMTPADAKDPAAASNLPAVSVDAGCSGVIPDAIVRADLTGGFEPSHLEVMAGAIVRFEPAGVTGIRSSSSDFETSFGDISCLTFHRPGSYVFDAWTNAEGRGTITVVPPF